MSFDNSQISVSTTGKARLEHRREFVHDTLKPVRHPWAICQQVVVLWRVHEFCSLGCRFCEYLFVDAQGRISPCSFSTREYGIPLSEVRSAAEFLELPHRFRQLRSQFRLAACHDCRATHLFDKFKGQPRVQGQPKTETPC